MRNTKVFSKRKLTTEEFTEKYRSGNPYHSQYINVSIDDGRDEGEQLIFNNIQELKARSDAERRIYARNTERRDKEIDELKERFADVIKIVKVSVLTSAIMVLIPIIVLCTLHCQKRKLHQR